VVAIKVVESTYSTATASRPSNVTRMPGSKPVPMNVTCVPPVSGPTTGEMLVNERPASCVKRTLLSKTLIVAVRGVGSGFAWFALIFSIPLPHPIGDVSKSVQDCHWLQSIHHGVCCCVTTL
jgi:hypothetical protein